MAQKMKESPVEGETPSDAKQPGSPKSRLAVLKRSSAKKAVSNQDPFRFQGQGVLFKGKLIGIRDVEGARGDAMCAEAMRQSKAAVKAAGTHKQRIQLYINIEGIKINDEKSGAVLYNFPVARISFIARDTSDARAFGFVFGESAGNYKFYGIKTAQTADHAVLSIRDMFQIVYEMKKKQIEQVKQVKDDEKKELEAQGVRTEDGVLVADLLDLETEVHNIEQGLNQLANIPVVPGDEWPGEQQSTQNMNAFADPFGAPAFESNAQPARIAPPVQRPATDPFGDTFNSTQSSTNFSFSTPQPQSVQSSVFGTPQSQMASPSQQAHFNHYQQTSAQQQWITPPQNFHHTLSTPSFSTTNPFADMASTGPAMPGQQIGVVPDPFDTSALRPNLPQGGVQWGNENTAPHLPHAHSFTANFDNISAPRKSSVEWDTGKKVTSLEDAFTKLVDMDSLVGRPAETKKNPFEHIINPPKVPLNSLGSAPAVPARPVTSVQKDPFGDSFFS